MEMYLAILVWLHLFASSNADLTTRIINGSMAILQEFPYQVWLYSDKITCNGVIIDSSHILTTAFCAKQRPTLIYVGYTNHSADHSGIITFPDQIFSHPGNGKSEDFTYTDNIAVIRVLPSFGDWTQDVSAIDIITTLPEAGTYCNVSGWGRTSENVKEASKVLNYVTVPIVAEPACKMSYRSYNTNGTFCAGYNLGEKGTCTGDSGGPLVCNKKLAGILSFSKGCAKPYTYSVYTDVTQYKDWIIAQTLRSSGDQQILSVTCIVAAITICAMMF